MRKIIAVIMILISLFGLTGNKSSPDPSSWSDKEIKNWFAKKEWCNGWTITPDASINKREFAISYFKNKDRWDKAFNFLKSTDFSKAEMKRYDIDDDKLFAVSYTHLRAHETVLALVCR